MSPARLPTYEELVVLVAELRERVASLEAENARLRAEVAGPPTAPAASTADAGGGDAVPPARRRPPRWAKANVVVVARTRPRRPRVPVPGRRRAIPDRIIVHAPTVCLHCATPLQRGRLVQRRQVIDLPPVRAEVVEHRVLVRTCPGCGAVCRGEMPDLCQQVGPHRRLSWRIAALVATLRTTTRLPINQLQTVLAQHFGLRRSVGTLCAVLAETARAGQAVYAGLLAEARASPVVHIDETGWRENGETGWIWTVSTPTVRYFQRTRRRVGTIALRLLGDDDRDAAGTATEAAVVVSDFYAGYDGLARTQQRCWAHLLRDLDELVTNHPDDGVIARWAPQVRRLYGLAVDWAARATVARTRPILRERQADRLAAELVRVCQRQPAGTPQATLCQRIARYRTDLFTFVADPAAPPTNNAAERSLRPLVIARKISGGTRSPAGTRTRMVLQSLAATWTVRGQDPFTEFLAVLRAPRPATPDLATV